MRNFPEQYVGKCIAMLGDETVIASGKNSFEAFTKAKKLYPSQKITLMYVPTKKELVTFL